ncbi:MAG: hypothetical protein QOD94_3212, partial [Alphaproteobacteria bacterium]|nr:hypothetical protein [Alphaproteobacteria bacterium]
RQYINGLMYLVTEEPGHRPYIIDDRNFYLPAGVRKWARKGFLNKEIKLTLGLIGTFRSETEALLLLQNAMLVTEAMGLGGWIHATMAPPFMLGHPMFKDRLNGKGLGVTYAVPRFGLFDILRWGTFLPKVRANPVGFRDLIRCMCPPNHRNMSEAVDALVEMKYGASGTYSDRAYFARIYKGTFGDQYVKTVPKFTTETIRCVKDICNYIYDTHGRFPAHHDAIYVPGVWLQAHHLDTEYYDFLFNSGYGDTHRHHQRHWHGA